MRAWIRRLLQVRDTPEALARGLAIGFFFGVSAFWGLQVVLAILFSHLLRGNKVVAAAMTVISNPLTNIPLYGLSFVIGHAIVGGSAAHPDFGAVHSLEGFFALGPTFLLAMLVGTTLVGLVGAVAFYFSAGRLLRWLGQRRARSGTSARPVADGALESGR